VDGPLQSPKLGLGVVAWVAIVVLAMALLGLVVR
jgi:hypothetical protein